MWGLDTSKELSEALDELKTQEKCQSRHTTFCSAVFLSGKRPQKSLLASTLFLQQQSHKKNGYGEMYRSDCAEYSC